MKRLSTLNSQPYQEISYITESSLKVTLTFRFLPTQMGWVVDIVSDKFNVYGIKLCCSPNLLDKWHNVLDFGINVTTDDGYDPFRLDDFESGYCYVCITNKEETKNTVDYLNGNT